MKGSSLVLAAFVVAAPQTGRPTYSYNQVLIGPMRAMIPASRGRRRSGVRAGGEIHTLQHSLKARVRAKLAEERVHLEV